MFIDVTASPYSTNIVTIEHTNQCPIKKRSSYLKRLISENSKLYAINVITNIAFQISKLNYS